MTKTYKGTETQTNDELFNFNNDEKKKTAKVYNNYTLVICRDDYETTRIMLNDYRIFNDQGFNVSFNKDHKIIIINDGNTIYKRFYYPINGFCGYMDGICFDDLEVRFYHPNRQEFDKLRESLQWLERNFLWKMQ